jgi:hypothetical protein
MMATGRCSSAEYRRMVAEKQRAAGLTVFAMLRNATGTALLQPWHKAAAANAKRLRRRR